MGIPDSQLTIWELVADWLPGGKYGHYRYETVNGWDQSYFGSKPMYEATGVITDEAGRKFITKDSGARENLANGMVRDTTAGKTDYTLLFDGPLLRRYAELLSRGAEKYGKRNWCKAFDAPTDAVHDATIARFQESATRHFFQWLMGDRTEDHAAAVIFNMNGYEAMTTGETK